MNIRPVGVELFHADRQTDGQTDRQRGRLDEANICFGNFANVSENRNDYRSFWEYFEHHN